MNPILSTIRGFLLFACSVVLGGGVLLLLLLNIVSRGGMSSIFTDTLISARPITCIMPPSSRAQYEMAFNNLTFGDTTPSLVIQCGSKELQLVAGERSELSSVELDMYNYAPALHVKSRQVAESRGIFQCIAKTVRGKRWFVIGEYRLTVYVDCRLVA